VIIKVTERDPGQLNFGLGVNTEFELTVRGYTGITYRNLGGTARALAAKVEVKRVADINNFIDHRLTLGYTEPFVFGTKTIGRIIFIRAREILSRNKSTDPVPVTGVETNKIQLLLERELNRNLKLIWNFWSLSQSREFDIRNENVIEDVLIGSTGPTLELEHRDDPYVPTKGTYSKLDIQFAEPKFLGSSSQVNYLLTSGVFNWYLPTEFLNMVWANSIAGGYLINLKSRPDSYVPNISSFKLGGRDTIRGFKPQEIPGISDRNGNTIRVFSDSHYYLFKSELRIPVFGDFQTVLFYDGGSVKVSGFDLRDEYRDSVGLGLRYMTPAGPFRLEYGYKLDRFQSSVAGQNEEEFRIHISFGTF
jgi:outer membrane protein assembly factor BamA